MANNGLYRKKPLVIEARQIDAGDVQDFAQIMQWCAGSLATYGKVVMLIPTLEGDMGAKDGDWIIRGVAGEYYPCDNDIFTRTYSKVEAAS